MIDARVAIVLCGALVWARLFLMGQTPAAPEARQFVVIGCIQPAAPAQADSKAEFTITDYRGGPVATFRLEATDSKLSPWVNDTVEIHGAIVAGSSGTDSKEAPKLNVDKVYVISRGCKQAQPSSAEK